ncbi:hypothetical protein ACFPL7_02145 [Dongia soli]|uniref:Transposase n=1 Tax=Dongia soli TaxID=600628 RepID=A0ABU5EG13_9PROT|nr:hypothetical protein [Dongia soli]MDY0885272.1 hypothetical protein [Dongia soli]
MKYHPRPTALRKAERELTVSVRELTDRCRENYGLAESHLWRRAEVAAKRLKMAEQSLSRSLQQPPTSSDYLRD